MLIPETKDGVTKWRWNNGALCDSKDEALSTATMDAIPDNEIVHTMDSIESLELE
jgi:hypothetical protein